MLQNIVDKLKYQSNRKSTEKVYYHIWKSFNQFFIKLDIKPETWEERLVLFVGYLVENNRRSQTIKSYISAIRSVLAKDGVFLNKNKFLLTSLTKACRLKNDKVRTHLPIRKGLLSLLVKSVEQLYPTQVYLATLYKATLVTAYFGLFCIGEVTKSEHVIKAKDVHIGDNKDKLLFVLHNSKTHGPDKKPQLVKLTKVHDYLKQDNRQHRLCPFETIHEYLQIRKSHSGPLEQFFVFRDRTPYENVTQKTDSN